jgi:glutamate---cysteine ligase / carboxylate-amine ligase
MSDPEWDWTRWTKAADDFTVGVEEEVMLLDRSGWSLDQAFDEVRKRLSPELADRLSAETHASTIEFETAPSPTAAAAAHELAALRAALAAELATLGRASAGSGTHPFVTWEETRISNEDRYRYLHRSMRELVHREPTFAMHVHVAIGDPELAVKVLNRMRVHLPLLLALSANSPFWQGRDSGIASIRTPIFGTFPRSGIPRRFDDYAQYTEVLGTLLACGAFPDPGFVWWDLRLQPTLGTVELRVMDTQPEPWRAGALIALTQSLTRLEALEQTAPASLVDAPELLEENRFRAARDGAGAELLDPERHTAVPVPELAELAIGAVRDHARDLGCEVELDQIERLVREPGFELQRSLAGEDGDLERVVAGLSERFTAPS